MKLAIEVPEKDYEYALKGEFAIDVFRNAVKNGSVINERDSYDCISREDTKEMIRKEFPRLEERVEINSIINMIPPVNPKCNKVFTKEDLDAVVKAVQDNYFNHLKEMKSEIVRLYDKARENYRDGYGAYCDGVDDCNSIIDKYCSKENKGDKTGVNE